MHPILLEIVFYTIRHIVNILCVFRTQLLFVSTDNYRAIYILAISKKAFEAISSILVKTETVRAFQAGGLKKRANERFRQNTQGN
jgi:hypothetical protein